MFKIRAKTSKFPLFECTSQNDYQSFFLQNASGISLPFTILRLLFKNSKFKGKTQIISFRTYSANFRQLFVFLSAPVYLPNSYRYVLWQSPIGAATTKFQPCSRKLNYTGYNRAETNRFRSRCPNRTRAQA